MKLRYISVAVICAVLLPLAASAQSVNTIQQQITQLLAEIAQLQQELNSMASSTAPTTATSTVATSTAAWTGSAHICPIFSRTLMFGSSGVMSQTSRHFLPIRAYTREA